MNGYDEQSLPLARRRTTIAEAATTTDMGPNPRGPKRAPQRNGYLVNEAKKGGSLPPWLKDKKGEDGQSKDKKGDSGEGGDSDNLPPWLKNRKKGRQAESALNPQIYPRETLERFHEAPLNARRRDGLPSGDFALPGRRYPIDTPARARAALSRVEQFGSPEEKSRVRAAVHRKYPDMDVS